jgi:hypothetical protein
MTHKGMLMNYFTHTILSEADWDSIQSDINVWEPWCEP